MHTYARVQMTPPPSMLEEDEAQQEREEEGEEGEVREKATPTHTVEETDTGTPILLMYGSVQ